jgi:outer membrane protein TolC
LQKQRIASRPFVDYKRPPPMKTSALVSILAVALPAVAQEKVTLTEAVRRALLRNPTTLQSAQDIVRAEALVEQIRSPAFPQLFGNAALTKLEAYRYANGVLVEPGNQRSANLTLTVPLVSTKSWAQWSQAKQQVELSRLSLEDSRRTVAVATARAYLAVMAQRRLAQVTEQAKVDAKAHLDDAHARFEVGSGNRLDEVRAGQELATDEAQLALALSNIVKAQEALGVLLGSEGPIDVEEKIDLPNPPAPDAALTDAETIRADVRVGKERAEYARRVVRDSWTDYMPLLTAVVEPFYQHPALATVPETGWQAQLVLSLPIYDGGLRYGQEKDRRAQYEEAKIQLDGLLRQARSDVRTAFDEVTRVDEELAAARKAARLAHEALDMTSLAYREGATNDLDVVDSQQRSRNADISALVAEDASRQARIDLLSASGHFP